MTAPLLSSSVYRNVWDDLRFPAVGINLFGLLDIADSFRLPAAYKPAIVYGAVILILLLRPTGLARRELL